MSPLTRAQPLKTQHSSVHLLIERRFKDKKKKRKQKKVWYFFFVSHISIHVFRPYALKMLKLTAFPKKGSNCCAPHFLSVLEAAGKKTVIFYD